MTDPHQHYRDALVATLRADSVLDETWASAFAAVPRHLLVPQWYGPDVVDGTAVWRRRHASEDIAGTYANETLVTALDPDTVQPAGENAWTGIPTSSSTAPGLMAGMLRDLDIEDGMRVLEIGTGTGYTTALLCERLGSENVYSIDVQPAVVDAARTRLHSAGYTPHLAAGDGRQKRPGLTQPVDRIIATCSIPQVPQAWISQLAPDGLILAAINLGIEAGTAALRPNNDGGLAGNFTRHTVSFMPARSHTPTASLRLDYAPTSATRPTRLTAGIVQEHYPYRLLLASRLPGAQRVMWTNGDERALQLQRPDGSAWARVPFDDGMSTTVTYGDTDLWTVAEQTWTDWNTAGQPTHDTFHITQQGHVISLATPGSP